jgi:hypothetical protein
MAYLGNAPARSFISFERQVFTIVNSQTAYTLSHSVNNENDIRLVINNIVQEPGSGKAYTASGTTLTLSAALTNGTDEMYCVFLGRATATNAPGAGSVNTAAIAADAITEAKIADDAVESEHLNDNVISGQTELAAEPADTDEFLVSDAGTLKRIDYSYIKAQGGLAMADQFRLSANRAADTSEDITTNIERVDTDGFGQLGTGMTESSGIFTFPSTGIYYLELTVAFYIVADNAANVSIYTTTDGTNYGDAAIVSSGNQSGGANEFTVSNRFIFDVTNTSTHKVKLVSHSIGGGSYVRGETDRNRTAITFFKLGDT